MKGLEERLGLRLLTRTTRCVSPTEAGDRLLQSLAPHFEEIEAEIAAVSDLRDAPAGTIRITATDYAANSVLWPKLTKVLLAYPDIRIELSIDYGPSQRPSARYHDESAQERRSPTSRSMPAGPRRAPRCGSPSGCSRRQDDDRRSLSHRDPQETPCN